MKNKELKTLKDIYGVVEKGKNELMDDWVSVQKLKAEAVKWVKELSKPDGLCYSPTQILKHFFNITEEELG